MSITVQAADTSPVKGSTVATKSPQFDVMGAFRALLSTSLGPTSQAVQDAFRAPLAGVYAAAPASEAERQICRLNALRHAGDGWAGPGSTAPNLISLNAAIDLIGRLKYLPLPIPMASIGSHGNAGLFWSDNALYADVELLEDGRIGYLLHVKGHSEVDNEELIPEVGLPPKIAQALAMAYLSNNR